MKVAVVGGGRIGQATRNLAKVHGIPCTIFDTDSSRGCVITDSKDELRDFDVIVNAGPYTINKSLIQWCNLYNKTYLDFSEDVESTEYAKHGLKEAKGLFIPQCGLAPGWTGIVANYLSTLLETVESIKIRVGALPQSAGNSLQYYATWSVDGLVNEYYKPATIKINGEIKTVKSLEGHEALVINGKPYEAFYTSGGIGSLCEHSKALNVNYKTLRYPGHLEYVRGQKVFLSQEEITNIWKENLPTTDQDVVVVYITACGRKNGKFVIKEFTSEFLPITIQYHHFTAIEHTTAAGMVIWLMYLKDRGGGLAGYAPGSFLPQEALPANVFKSYLQILLDKKLPTY